MPDPDSGFKNVAVLYHSGFLSSSTAETSGETLIRCTGYFLIPCQSTASLARLIIRLVTSLQ